MAIYYLDSSAVLKTFTQEREKPKFIKWLESLRDTDALVVSNLTVTEVQRAVNRINAASVSRTEDFFTSVNVIRLTPSTYEEAAKLQPYSLKTLDALHLATALSLCGNDGALVSYDQQMIRAATINNLDVVTPS